MSAESLPMAHYDRVANMDGVLAATHMNWFGGYFQEPRNFLPTFAVDPQTYFRVYSEDLTGVPAAQRCQGHQHEPGNGFFAKLFGR